MKYDETAYGKFGSAMTEQQINKWNDKCLEMWILADYFVDRHQLDGNLDKAKRLKDLIGQLPVFDSDGEGYRRTGNDIEEF